MNRPASMKPGDIQALRAAIEHAEAELHRLDRVSSYLQHRRQRHAVRKRAAEQLLELAQAVQA